MPIKTLLIGLGNVGMGYDYHHPDRASALTHSAAISTHSAFALHAGIDPNYDLRSAFVTKFDRPAFDRIDAVQEATFDLVVVATPVGSHSEVVLDSLREFRPSVILLEKPIALTLRESTAILEACAQSDCALFVNYHRSASPAVRDIKKYLSTAKEAGPYKGVAWYSKGIQNNGSHIIALLVQLLGPISTLSVLAEGPLDRLDPEPDCLITFDSCSVYLLSARHENFEYLGFQLVDSNGTIELGGVPEVLSRRTVSSDPQYPTYQVLDNPKVSLEPENFDVFLSVYDAVADHFEGRSVSLTTGREALYVQETITRTIIMKRKTP